MTQHKRRERRKRKYNPAVARLATKWYYWRNREAKLLCTKLWRGGVKITMAEARQITGGKK